MGWHEHWYYMTSEIAARGWRAFVYGPEAWLVIPPIMSLIGLIAGFILPGLREKRRATRAKSYDERKNED